MIPNKIKILIVDDSAFIRKALEMMINEDPGMEVVGLARNGKEGVDKAAELNPDIITMDVEMPVMNGLDALSEIMATKPKPVIMISSLTEEGAEVTIKALEMGAVDFIPKKIDLSSTEIIRIKAELLSKIRNIAVNKPKIKPHFVAKVDSPKMSGKKGVSSAGTPRGDALAVQQLISTYRILGIGSSTGGPMALQNVIPYLPANISVPVVIAQHMPPMFTRSLAKRLNELSKIEVVEAEDKMELRPGVAYIGKGGFHIQIKRILNKDVIQLVDDRPEYLYKPSVDLLFNTMADIYKDKIVAVLLTGMGKDGAMGMLKIKNSGGYTIAQDEESSVIYGMPKAAADIGAARKILPVQKIPEEISKVMYRGAI